jgi:N-acetylmuramoyl-L-alanine amidase
MQEELYQAVGLRNAGLFNNRGFVVINRTAEPSVLLEVAFLSNAKEEGLLRDPNFRQKAAEGILNGLRRYAGTTDWQLRRAEAPAAL